GLSPNGLLTANGLCTYETLGAGLFAAGADVLLTAPPVARVIAVALPAAAATFAGESFPLVVGNRVELTTYENPDPGVGGAGFNPADYVISFDRAAPIPGGGPNLGTAVIVDPAITALTGGPAPIAGGAAALSGFTVAPTQANIDCPGTGRPADASDA